MSSQASDDRKEEEDEERKEGRGRFECSAKGHFSARRIGWLVGRPSDIMPECKGELPLDAQKYSGELIADLSYCHSRHSSEDTYCMSQR